MMGDESAAQEAASREYQPQLKVSRLVPVVGFSVFILFSPLFFFCFFFNAGIMMV